MIRKELLRSMLNAVITAGVIIWLIGLYYFMIKAGIPYQDPPLDLWIQYEVNAGIGDVLMGMGFQIALCSGVLRLVLNLIWKKKQEK